MGRLGSWSIPAAAALGALSFPLAPLVGYASTRAFQASLGIAPPAVPPWIAPFLEFSEPAQVYATYGRVWVVVFGAFLVAALHLRARLRGRLAPWGSRGTTIMVGGLCATTLGVVGDYWLGRDVLGQALWGMSFLVTMLGLLAYMMGSALLARDAFRSGAIPRMAAHAFALAPLGIVVNTLLIPNAPAAYVPALALGWIALAVAREKPAATPAPAPLTAP